MRKSDKKCDVDADCLPYRVPTALGSVRDDYGARGAVYLYRPQQSTILQLLQVETMSLGPLSVYSPPGSCRTFDSYIRVVYVPVRRIATAREKVTCM